jgi:acyl-coenzyme A thioesterase PaaI-like protein
MTADTKAFIAIALAAQLPLVKLGVKIDTMEAGSVTLSVLINEDMTTQGTGVVMAGVIAMIGDVAAGLSVISLMESPRPVTTIDFTSHQISAAKGDKLIIIGKAERLSKTICISGAEAFCLRDDQSRKCATLTATFLLS